MSCLVSALCFISKNRMTIFQSTCLQLCATFEHVYVVHYPCNFKLLVSDEYQTNQTNLLYQLKISFGTNFLYTEASTCLDLSLICGKKKFS